MHTVALSRGLVYSSVLLGCCMAVATTVCPALTDALLAASPDFQTKLGYPLPPPNGANLSTASKANAQKYNTLSLVLEQPFKDNQGDNRGGAMAASQAPPCSACCSWFLRSRPLVGTCHNALDVRLGMLPCAVYMSAPALMG